MARAPEKLLRVFVYGAGKVGTALARELRRAGMKARLHAARNGLPRRIDADVVILAVRDRDLRPLAESMRGVVNRRAVVVHVAGALDAEVLAPLRGFCAGVGQMHPMISFASPRVTPDLSRGNVHVQGDAAAVARSRRIARMLEMTPRTVPGLDPVAYHAAAGLVANGAAALAALGAQLLAKAGVPPHTAAAMLGPLLRSVANNMESLGFPAALTGPVRRGDSVGVEKHLAVLRQKLPGAVRFYLAAVDAQLPIAAALGEASEGNLEAIRRVVDAESAKK